jgi:hypothetical protein
MLLYSSKYLSVNYLEVQYLMHIKFSEQTKNATEQELKADFLLFYDKMVKRRGRHFLIDTENIENIISSKFVVWFTKTVFPLVKSVKADKIAWLFKKGIPDNFDIDEKATENVVQKIFDNSQQAMKWLLENAETKKLSFENGSKPPNPHHLHH